MTGIEILGNPAITTPGGIIIAVLIYIANQYFRNRQENRTDLESRRSTESGIVETSKAALAAVREQVDAMREDALLDRKRARQREQELQAELDELRLRLERAEDDNRALRQRLGVPPPSTSRSSGIRGYAAPVGEREPELVGRDSSAGYRRRRSDPAEPDPGGTRSGQRRYRYRDEGGAGEAS